MMRHIAVGTDHVLLSTLAANACAIDRGELVPLPLVDPRISVTFAIIRLAARTLPPIADELIREVIAADCAALEVARRLAGGLGKPMPAHATDARPTRPRRGAAVAVAR
jgi:hypothetical protein